MESELEEEKEEGEREREQVLVIRPGGAVVPYDGPTNHDRVAAFLLGEEGRGQRQQTKQQKEEEGRER